MPFRLALLSLLSLILAAADPQASLRAVRTAQPIRVDGRLDETAWSQAPVLRDFTQNTPMLGMPSRKRTEVRVLYDNRFLYVGARMHHDAGSPVVKQVHRRDQSSASDWFGVLIDSALDHRSAFSFLVNASNVQRDGLSFEDGSSDWSWDGVWESAVQVDDAGWTAELKIPLSLLRFQNGPGPLAWGVNFARRDEGKEREVSYWYVPPRGESVWVSQFHHLVGLENLQPPLRREWVPYVSAQRKFETAQPYDDRGWTLRGGFDAHLGLSSHAQVDLTVHPDFGQVEVDQAVINLGTVETLFPEKRPFFLEGMDIFQVPGASLFYSRRLGKGLDGPDPALNTVAWPRAVEIAAAGKFTTKSAGGFSLGVLGASMEVARATLRDGTGTPFQEEVSPYTSAGVVHATQSLDERGSYLGTFASFLREASPTGRTAVVNALDGVWKSKDLSTSLDGVFAHSGAGPRGEVETGNFLRVHLVSAWGRGWSLDGNAFNVTKTFNPNDLGYLNRPDRKGFTFDLDRRWDIQRGVFRNPMWRFTYVDFTDQAGKPYLRTVESWGKVEFTNEWDFFSGGGAAAAIYDDRELRTFEDAEKKYLRIPEGQWAFLGLDSPPNLPWVVNLQWVHVWREGGPKNEFEFNQTYKPLPRLELRSETAYTAVAGEWHWLETQGTTPIVGTRKLSQLDQVIRIAYAFSPTLTMQVFSQWLGASWDFRDLRAYVDDRTLAPGATAIGPLASSVRLWNVNLITRWEFRPGSSLFLVYTHGASTDELINDRASLSPRRDLAIMGHLPSDDIMQVKVSWLFR